LRVRWRSASLTEFGLRVSWGGEVRELWDLEQAGWEALSGGDPRSHYDTVLSEDAVMVVPNMVLDRAAALGSWQGVPPWEAYELTNRAVLELGPDSVALIYHATAHRAGQHPPYRAVMTSVYVYRGDEWKLALHQQTPVS
jgi:hypothetical protein